AEPTADVGRVPKLDPGPTSPRVGPLSHCIVLDMHRRRRGCAGGTNIHLEIVMSDMTRKSPAHLASKPTDPSINRRKILLGGTTLAAASAMAASAPVQTAQAQQRPAPAAPATGQKPNILVIFGDDIGIPQISAYTMGMMGYRTPNIDRI